MLHTVNIITICFSPHTTYLDYYKFLHNVALKPRHLPIHKYLKAGSASKALHLFAHPTRTILVLLFTVTHALSIRLYSTLGNHLYRLHKNLLRPAEWICGSQWLAMPLLYTAVTNRLPAFVFRACGDKQARRIFCSVRCLIC